MARKNGGKKNGEQNRPHILKHRSKKEGLPPGTPVYIGKKRIDEPRITIIDYDEEHFQEKEAIIVEECFPFKETETVTWINVDGINNVNLIEKIGQNFSFHPLLVEDIVNTDQRPKFEDFGDYLYIVLRALEYDEQQHVVHTEQMSIVIASNFLITFQETPGDVFNTIRERLRLGKGRIRKMGPDYLAYSLMDAIVDHYFFMLEKMGEQVEVLEESIISRPVPRTVQELHKTKRELILLRKSVWPLREVINNLQHAESPLVSETTRLYLRDVHDHTVQVMDTVETYRDITQGMLDIYLSSISNKMNEIMKVLTIIGTIFIPLTFLAGVYGMNFHYFPEITWKYGYAIFWSVCIVLAGFMLIMFRRKGWL
jgi:magnesium transporter